MPSPFRFPSTQLPWYCVPSAYLRMWFRVTIDPAAVVLRPNITTPAFRVQGIIITTPIFRVQGMNSKDKAYLTAPALQVQGMNFRDRAYL
jgi:hypothetical protein